MPSTKDYEKLGYTTYVAALYGDDGDNPYRADLCHREFFSKAAAERWVRETLPREQKATTLTVHGSIRQGVYEDNSFDDNDYGRVRDAVWEPTELAAYCQLVDGQPEIEWEVE
jgi:hypothetical protein